MDSLKKISKLLKKRVILLDGACGTQLQERGMPAGVCPEAWCIKNPRVLGQVHSDYLDAGSDIIYTCTFGANRFKLSKFKLQDKTSEINRKLALLARQRAGDTGLVAGDIGPTGCFVQPYGNIRFEDMVDVFKEQVKGLLKGGVDLFVIETMLDIQEARAALLAVKELSDRFVMVTMTYDKSGRTLNGTDPLSALVTLQSLGADAVGCNCSSGPQDMLKLIKLMKPYAVVPLVAKPNAGIPELLSGKTVFSMGPGEFASACGDFIPAGANFLGGCCGTTPEYIAELKKQISGKGAIGPARKSLSALSSSRKTVILNRDRDPVIVGEKINPTGKKLFQKELLAGNMSLVRQLAKDQERGGADVLDVNLGVAGIDEIKMMEEAIGTLSTITELPLVIDSSDVRVVERALRLYPGRAMINSISGEKHKIKKLLPVAAKYGAMFILLPLNDSDIPQTFEKRRKIIQSVFRAARKAGFTKDDLAVDGLIMSVSSHQSSAEETLKTIEWASGEFGVNTIFGLSNISFGMPNRKPLNAEYFALAIARGLTMAIADPLDQELMRIRANAGSYSKETNDVKKFLNNCARNLQEAKKETPVAAAAVNTPSEKVSRSVMEGDRDGIIGFLTVALSAGVSASALVDEAMTPAIIKVGEMFDKKEYFLPQLIASAEAMKKGIEYLEPYLKKESPSGKSGATIVIATVKGDVHDIGKNIVSLMLKNHGFNVIDLGKDIPASKIIRAARQYSPLAVGLSALMTTTMVEMKAVIADAKKQGLKCKFIVGGAVLNEVYAHSIGALYARDAVGAVKLAESLKEG